MKSTIEISPVVEMRNVKVPVGTEVVLQARKSKEIYLGTVKSTYSRHVVIEYSLRKDNLTLISESFLKTELLHNSNSDYLFLKIKKPVDNLMINV